MWAGQCRVYEGTVADGNSLLKGPAGLSARVAGGGLSLQKEIGVHQGWSWTMESRGEGEGKKRGAQGQRSPAGPEPEPQVG